MRRRLTLARVFYLSIAGLIVLLGGLLYVLRDGSRRAIAESAARLRESASGREGRLIESYLGQAKTTVDQLRARLQSGACPASEPADVESCLYAAAAANHDLAEVTFTHAIRLGFAHDGSPRLAPEGRWQVSVYRDRVGPGAKLCTRRSEPTQGRFVGRVRCRDPARVLLPASGGTTQVRVPEDPTTLPTFYTPASKAHSGQLLHSDLSYFDLDRALPPAKRRVVVTALEAIEGSDGSLLGVVQVGLLAQEIDAEIAAINRHLPGPYRIFVCDASGRFVTKLAPGDPIELSHGEDLRVVPRRVPRAIQLAVASPALRRTVHDAAPADGRFELAGRPYAVEFRPLPHTQGWFVGVVGPEDYYLSGLRHTVGRLLWLTIAVVVIILVGGVLTLRAVRGGLSRITRETDRMHAFDFAPSPTATPFGDVAAVLGSVEQAKTAMRAMRKYVPVEVVRYFYESNHEPTLGGRLEDVSLMFSDIRDFTTLSETLAPDRLARLLGHYLGAMTEAVHEADGTVDKYVGDAVMALWNAPRTSADHPVHACRAALACIARTDALFASPAWEGLPPLVTRFGIHRAQVMVGHFGAPDRFSFTAIGDGVNLAARLEGLNKQYGTTILVSSAIEREAREAFAFRRIDRVAVKGKSVGVEVYELLGELGQVAPAKLTAARRYEAALDAYFARDFERARDMLGDAGDDGPSRVLAERCRVLRNTPPPADWDGTYLAKEK